MLEEMLTQKVFYKDIIPLYIHRAIDIKNNDIEDIGDIFFRK